jgi:hypothetical protein
MAARVVPEYVHLDADDDAASVRDRLAFLRGRHVLLIWPEVGSPLRRKLDLVLIQREAMRRAVRLALVTHDLQVIRHAAELNISTFETIQDSQKRKWKRGRSRVFAARLKRPGTLYDPDELMPYASRLREGEVTAFQRFLRAVVRLSTLMALILTIAASAALIVPGAVVTLSPAQTIARISATITADPIRDVALIDVENGIIPAALLRVEVEERASLPTTGLQEMLSTPALGSVVFINRGERAVEVLAGSLVSTSAGTPIVFRTLNDVIVPAGVGRQIEVPIEAIPESAGEIGNVPAGLINTVIGPLAESLEVRNLAPTFGGRSNVVRIVTAADRERLIGVLRQQLQERAFRELSPRLSGSQFLVAETVRISDERSDWLRFDHEVGAAADNLTLTMRAVVSIVAVDEALAQQIAYARLSQQVERGRVLVPDSVRFQRGPISAVDQEGRVIFTMLADGAVRAQIDPAALAARLAGLPVDEARQYLMRELDLEPGTEVIIELSPPGLPLMPLIPLRIQLNPLIPMSVQGG